MSLVFSRIGLLGVLLFVLPSQSPAQTYLYVYDLSAESDLTVFSVVENWGDTETTATHVVTDIDLSFYLWDDEGDIMEVLTAPNGLTKDEWIWADYSADIDVVADGRMFRQGWGRCTRWEDDLTYCNMDGDGGTFLIEREIKSDEIWFHLMLRWSPEQIEFEKEYNTGFQPSINIKWPENGYSASMILTSGTVGRVTFVLPLYNDDY